jgi:hypothetical protein
MVEEEHTRKERIELMKLGGEKKKKKKGEKSMYTRARQDKTLFLKHAISKRCPCLRSRTTATLVSRFCPTGCVTLLDMSTLARVVDSFSFFQAPALL